MATVDSIDAFSLLQNMAPMSYDSSRLVDVACIAYAHVDAAHIRELRGKFLATVQKQFQVAALQPTIPLSEYPGKPCNARFACVLQIRHSQSCGPSKVMASQNDSPTARQKGFLRPM